MTHHVGNVQFLNLTELRGILDTYSVPSRKEVFSNPRL